MEIYQNLWTSQVIWLIKHWNKMTYPSIIIFAKESFHIPLLETFVFLLSLSGSFRIFIFDQRIGLISLVLSHFILLYIQTIIKNIFRSLRLHITLIYTLANGIFSLLIIPRYLIKINVQFGFLLILRIIFRFTLLPIIFYILFHLSILNLVNWIIAVEVV